MKWCFFYDDGRVRSVNACEQMDERGKPLPEQVMLPDDDPRVVARLNPPEVAKALDPEIEQMKADIEALKLKAGIT